MRLSAWPRWRLPVGGGDAVFDERVGGGGVGDTQQGFGEAEQGDAFLGSKAVLSEEVGDVGPGFVGGAGGTDQGTSAGLDGAAKSGGRVAASAAGRCTGLRGRGGGRGGRCGRRLAAGPAWRGTLCGGTGDRTIPRMAVLQRMLWRGGVAAVFAVVLMPMVAVVWLSFFDQEIVSFPPSGYTLHWYVNAWEKPQFARGFFNSLELAVAATAIGVTVGTAAAYALVRGRFRGRGVIGGLLLGPLAIPGVVLGTGLYVFFVQIDNAVDFQIVATLPGLIAAHVLLTVPWTVRLVAASLQGLHPAAEEAAANWGRGRSRCSGG